MDLVFDPGIALLAGLNVVPKRSYLAAYSSRVDHRTNLALMAASLYRLMAAKIGREYERAQAKKIFRNLLDVSATVVITRDQVVLTLNKRAHNPYLVASGLADKPTPMPWFGNKKLVIRFA
jgi:hypothetical protein